LSRYRKVDSRIWNDQKFRALTDDAKLAFFMLLTHPSMTALGGMRASVAGLAEEMGWSTATFRNAFQEILKKGMAKHDGGACLVILPNFLRYNRPESPNVVKAWADSLDLVPECELKDELIRTVKAFSEGLSEGFREALPEAFREAKPKSMSNQEQEQEQEQEPEPDSPLPPSPETQHSSPCDQVLCVWNYYRERLKRDSHLALTAKRRAMGEAGLKACRRLAVDAKASDPDGFAVQLMKIAVDRLAESAWHNGKNSSGKRYLDWEILFRSRELPCPEKLTDFWLDDDKFPAMGGAA
jgi:hypothetical protein